MQQGRRTRTTGPLPTARVVRIVIVMALAALASLAGGAAPSATAHESTPDGLERLEITLGSHQLGLTITPPADGGGRASVVVVPRGAAPSGSVAVAVVPAGAVPPAGQLVPASPAGRASSVALDVPAAGAWELTVADGPDVARIPIDVAAPAPTPGWVWVLRVAAPIGIVALIVAVAPSVVRRPRVALPVGAVALVAVTVTVAVAVLGPSVPPSPTTASSAAGTPDGHAGHGGMAGMAGMAGTAGMGGDGAAPGAMSTAGAPTLTARTVGPAPAAGTPTELVLDLTDSSGGAPVDDLVVHDEALMHLAVVGPGGQLFHVHPVRVAAGRYAVRILPSLAGRYGVFAEMERAGGSGHVTARTALDVGGPAPTTTVPSPPPGPREIAGMQVDATVSSAVVGRPARIAVTFARGSTPVTDLQQWLGMAGHLMVLGPGLAGAPDPGDPASAFAHVHDMSPPGAAGTFGPQVGFDYTFPREGRYQLWVQVQRDWQVVTLPVTVDVRADTAP